MFSLSHKAKQYLLVALKVLILGATFIYIYIKLAETNASVITILKSPFQNTTQDLTRQLILIFILVLGNWFFEISKWKIAISHLQHISYLRALKESLSALTVSLTTPNRIGDYGAKAYFYAADKRKKILLLNFLVSGSQMAVTCIFGTIGILFIVLNYDLKLQTTTLILLSIVALLFAFLVYLFKERELLIKGFSIANVWRYYGIIDTSIKIKVMVFSVIRYVLFSYLFYYLLCFFGAEISLHLTIFFIFAMYLLVSILPSVFIFDVVVRGGVAVWLFSIIGVDEVIVLATVLAMWVLNTIIPAVLGSYFVARYKHTIA
ncbi:hypothetical protein ULMS_00270 [Patiriisocius marinistellae]|uniref:Uncharacterized protein n=1 Tax=Patiriisocius marinistellae TaxID=2494560 RepID=A0A5J4FWU6_9FLAO|nr:hypothetical protein [Patiriisocius marinistellae]GEQ84519.1 hypothetical protein ULMS_00270 [Patiriisocius marinistellae]